MLAIGFTQSQETKLSDTDKLFLAVYVDDCYVVGTDTVLMKLNGRWQFILIVIGRVINHRVVVSVVMSFSSWTVLLFKKVNNTSVLHFQVQKQSMLVFQKQLKRLNLSIKFYKHWVLQLRYQLEYYQSG